MKLKADIYRRAAEQLDREQTSYSCIALIDLCKAGTDESRLHVESYRRLFGPQTMREADLHPFWNRHPGASDGRVQGRRILALLFMAAMVESGDA